MVKPDKKQGRREGPESNVIKVPFEKAVDILPSTPPKKSAKRKKKSNR